MQVADAVAGRCGHRTPEGISQEPLDLGRVVLRLVPSVHSTNWLVIGSGLRLWACGGSRSPRIRSVWPGFGGSSRDGDGCCGRLLLGFCIRLGFIVRMECGHHCKRNRHCGNQSYSESHRCLPNRAFRPLNGTRVRFAAVKPCILCNRSEESRAYGVGTVTLVPSTVADAAPPAAPANSLPSTTAPVFNVIDTAASTFPLKSVVVSIVAEVPTCQKMLLALAPPARITWEAGPVVSVDPILKTKTAFGSPWASRVTLLLGPAPMIKTDVELT